MTTTRTGAGRGASRSVLPASRREVRWLGAGLAVAVLLGLTGLTLPSGDAAAAGPAAPTMLRPDDTTGRMRTSVELTWQPVAGATSYEVQVSDSGSFGDGVLAGTATLPRWTLPATTPTGDYAWRVRARSTSGSGAWSRTAQFTRGWADRPGSPVTFTGDGTPIPAVSWAPMPDASFYEVEFSTVPFDAGQAPYEATLDHAICYTEHTYLFPYGVLAGKEDLPGKAASCVFTVGAPQPTPSPTATTTSSPTATATPTPTTSATPSTTSTATAGGSFMPGRRYYWRVRGRDSTVDTRPSPFGAPAVACTGVWFESEGIAAQPLTNPPDVGGGATSGLVTVTVPIPGRVPAYDPTPDCSSWTDGGSFVVTPVRGGLQKPPAPGGLRVEPTAGSPTATTVAALDTPLFRWDKVPGAVKYRIYVGRSPDLRDVDHIWETLGTSLMPYGALPERGLKTYWTVQACPAATWCSDPAPVHAFTKKSAVTTAAVSSATHGNQTTLTWRAQKAAVPSGQRVPAGPGAKAFQVQIGKGTFDALLVNRTVDRLADPGNTATSRLVVDNDRFLDDAYVWRVRPVDEAGQQLPWSPGTGRFVINRQRPVVSLPKPAEPLAARGALRITFSEPVHGVTARTTGVKAAGTSRTVGGRLRPINATTWAFTPSRAWTVGQSYVPWVTTAVRDSGGSTVLPIRYAVRASTRAEAGGGSVRAHAGDYRWARVSASDAGGGSYLRTSDRPSTAARSSLTATVTGSRVSLVACRTPSSGVAAVTVDGHRYRVDLYRSYSGCGRVWTSPRLPKRAHTVVVATTGDKRSASRGYQLGVDAITVS